MPTTTNRVSVRWLIMSTLCRITAAVNPLIFMTSFDRLSNIAINCELTPLINIYSLSLISWRFLAAFINPNSLSRRPNYHVRPSNHALISPLWIYDRNTIVDMKFVRQTRLLDETCFLFGLLWILHCLHCCWSVSWFYRNKLLNIWRVWRTFPLVKSYSRKTELREPTEKRSFWCSYNVVKKKG